MSNSSEMYYNSLMNDMRMCNICGAPWHESTGHIISETMVWCGPCTKEWASELRGMQKRRWGGEVFYNHAKHPPPAVEYNYAFHLDKFDPVPNKPFTYQGVIINSTGVTPEEAFLKIRDQVPDGNRVLNWQSKDDPFFLRGDYAYAEKH